MKFVIKKPFFDIRQTLLCGQCFRWRENENGVFEGVAMERKISLEQHGDEITVSGAPKKDIPLWERYFDLDTDYGTYVKLFSVDSTLRKACESSGGIHILRQEPFETLISFIISQNNNIPRISGIIERLCEGFGEKIGEDAYAFPTADRLAGVTPDDLAPLRAGFRARYICDAVSRVASGEICFEEIDSLPLDAAREKLKRIVGVGDKVADCVALFAFHKLDAFPKDVWVKRLTAQLYPDGLPQCVKGFEGVAQQYLFDYVRNNNGLSQRASVRSD